MNGRRPVGVRSTTSAIAAMRHSDVEPVGVPTQRDERRDQEERQCGIRRPRHELDVGPVSLPERPRRVELVVRRIHDHVGELSAPQGCRAVRPDAELRVAVEDVERRVWVAALEHQTGRAIVERDRVVVIRGPVPRALSRHVRDPRDGYEGHDAREEPDETMNARVGGRCFGVALSRTADRRDEHHQRGADRDDDRDRTGAFGSLDDDAVEESGVVERRARDRDRGHPKQRAHAD